MRTLRDIMFSPVRTLNGRGRAWGIQSASEVHDADPALPAAFLSLKML